MTTDKDYSERNRDIQDGVERHVWGDRTFKEGKGSVMRLRGTDTEEIEVPVLVSGYSFTLRKDANAEVFTFADGSDMNLKFAMPTLARDKQREWEEGTGGIQNPEDPTKAVEFNGKRTHLTEDNAAIGSGGVIEVVGSVVYIRGDVHIAGNLTIGGNLQVGGNISTAARFIGPIPAGSGPRPDPIPAFDP